jgi:hypothetical protein
MCRLPPAGIGDSARCSIAPAPTCRRWFLAAYLMGRDERGVSAKFLQWELGVAYQTARPLRGFLEADETFIGGRGNPSSPGRSTKNPDKS